MRLMNALQPTSIRVTFCAVLLAILLSGWSLAQDANKTVPPPFVPKITIGKETTWVTEPLKANGTIDYHAVINRYYSRGVTTENNSVVLLYRAMGPKPGGGRLPNGFFEALGIEAPREEGDDLNRERFLGDDVLYSRPWTTEEFPADAAWLRSVEKPLDLVVEATRRREYFSPMVSDGADDPLFATLLPGVQETRSLTRTVVSRAMWRLGEEQRFEAWADLMAVHRLGRLMSRDSCFIGWLVGSANEQLAIEGELRFLTETQPTARQLKFYRRDLQKLPQRASLFEKIDMCERACALDACQRIARGTMTLNEAIITGTPFVALESDGLKPIQEGNEVFVVETGIGLVAGSIEDVPAAVRQVLTQPQYPGNLKRAHHTGVFDAVKEIERLLGQNGDAG